MSSLSAQKCEACHADAPKVSDAELAELIKKSLTGCQKYATVLCS